MAGEIFSFNLKNVCANHKIKDKRTNEDLVKTIQTDELNKEEAMNELILRNGRLILSIITHNFSFIPDKKIDDAFQQGILGIMRATETYNPDYSTKFSTYMFSWIKHKISRYIEGDDVIRIPVHLNVDIKKLEKLRKEYIVKYACEPTDEWLIEETGWDINRFDIANSFNLSLISYDKPLSNEDVECDATILDNIADDSLSTFDLVVNKELHDILVNFVKEYASSERNYDIFMLRTGLLDGEEKTLEEVGQIYGLSRERVRQIESKIKNKIASPKNMRLLRDFLYD